MAFIKVGNKVLKCDGKVVTNDLVLLVKLGGDGKTLTVTPTKDISATLTRYMLVLTPASGSPTEVNIGNTGTYDLSSLHGTVQDGKYTLSVYAVLSSGNTAPFGSIEYYVLAPCNAMTLRFKFSKSGYDPVNAGVGSAGTWNHLIDDVWDWTNTNADWHEAFKGAFAADDNEVEVIGAGDTSGVTNVNKMFAGIYSGTPSSNWTLNPVPDVPIPSPKIIYLTKDESSTATDPYTEWIWTQGDPTVTPPTSDKWVIIGTTSIALEDLDSTVDSGQDNHIEIEIVETNGKLASVTVVRDDTETVDNKIAAWGTPTDTQYPSAKLTKDTLDTKADKVTVPAGSDPSGHIPELDEHGNLEDSGIEAANLVTDVTVNSESVVDRQTKTAVIQTATYGTSWT